MNTPDPRRLAFDLIADGIDAGLPVPRRIDVGDADCNRGDLTLCFGDDAQAAVDRWALWLDLPRPVMAGFGPIEGASRWFRVYLSSTRSHEVTRRRVTAQTYATVPAPADAEAVTR